jgi:hypothetical protein
VAAVDLRPLGDDVRITQEVLWQLSSWFETPTRGSKPAGLDHVIELD